MLHYIRSFAQALFAKTRLPYSLPLILAMSPLAWLALFYGFVVRVRIHLGEWPWPYHPDPKDLGFDFHFLAIYCLGVMLPVFGLGALVLAGVIRYFASDYRLWPVVATLIFCTILLIILILFDPGHFFDWFRD